MIKLLQDHELHELYDDMLDDVYGEVKIAGLSYATSSALKNIDEVAYLCGFNDWLDSQVTDGILFEHDGEYYDGDPKAGGDDEEA
jgi:hypothetical protein